MDNHGKFWEATVCTVCNERRIVWEEDSGRYLAVLLEGKKQKGNQVKK